jgi:tRNA(Ile)-lysidine synthase
MRVSEAASPAKPIDPDEFDGLMARLGPFEKHAYIAIACSGGPDSMALALLADSWAKSKGGSATALIVDHGLRPESGDEAQTVLQRLNERGIKAIVLERIGGPISSDIQARARDARYQLMTQYCADHGVLHLLFGHHRMDQAETMLLRMERGSGVYGLSGMAKVREVRPTRILRPLLGVPKARLRATVDEFDVDVVDDPSNEDLKFDRVRIRRSLMGLKSGPSIAKLCDMADRMGSSRAALEDAVANALAQTCVIFPEGYGLLDWEALSVTPLDIRHRALARIVACIGGNPYTPRYKRLQNLDDMLMTGNLRGGRTLAGCRILRRKSKLLICREPSAIRDVLDARGNARGNNFWDGRYRIQLNSAPNGVVVKKLGNVSLAFLGASLGAESKRALIRNIPPAVRPGLPAFWRGDRLLAAPYIGCGNKVFGNLDHYGAKITFAPRNPLTSARFTFA